MEKFKVVVDRKAIKFLEKLSKTNFEVAQALYLKIASLSDSPYDGKPLKGNYSGFLRIRVWDYRVIYKVIENRKEVFVAEVGHRREIYR